MHHTGFVHLHLHTKYSLLDGANKIEDIVAKAAEYHMPALAITDHGNMFGAIEFYQKASKAGVKPIIGCETYIARNGRLDRTPSVQGGTGMYHLILLARNNDGYKNLMRLVSIGYREGFYYKPRIDKEVLEQHSGGLIGLSACLKGEVASRLLNGDTDGAREAALEYRRILGAENFYLEIQDNGLEEQKVVNERLIELSEELGVPLVATSDCHYFRKEDAQAHEALLCVQTGKTMSDPSRMRFSTQEFYFKSPEEMVSAFEFYPEAIANTVKVAERCNVNMEFGKHHLPQYEVPEEHTRESYLEELSLKGLDERFGEIEVGFGASGGGGVPLDREAYKERLRYELDVINRMGFAGYFLIVWDFINYAKQRGIPVGPGRGSAAGSLVAYSLRITDINPIPYGLLFERFLNPERISMPDIDIDFCMDRRDEVIRYVREKYGYDHVSQIITFGTMLAKGVIRDVGRVLDMPFGEVDKVAKLVPDELGMTLDKALEREPKLKDLIKTDERVAELFKIAKVLEGLTRHASKHAAGIVIGEKPLTEYCPLYRDPKDSEDEVSTQYDKDRVEDIGLVKFDFLGLRTLTVIRNAEDMINTGRPVGEEQFSVTALAMDDEKTYELLSSGDTFGVFQLESSGMRDIIMRLKPNCFEDIIALVALYRPGPLGSGMVDDFIQRKRGNRKIVYPLPELEGILKDTYGVILYQEQVMQIASKLAGFSMGQADSLRKAMGKKKPEVMAKQKDAFMEGAKERKVNEKKAEEIFDLMAKFAEYGFNKSHSAAYALISYQTAYLKAHYPVEFMAALMSSDMANTDKVVSYIGNCRTMGIDILPPDVNRSHPGFSVDEGRIRFGLAAVKNVGHSAIEAVREAREEQGEFTSVFDFCRKVDLRRVNKRVVEALVKCGAFDFSGATRAGMFSSIESAFEGGGQAARDRQAGQTSMFDIMSSGDGAAEDADVHPDIPEWNEGDLLAKEKEALGFYISGHPLARYENEARRYARNTTAELSELEDGRDVTLTGVISSLKHKLTKAKKEKWAIINLEDLTGMVEVLVFPELFRNSEALLDESRHDQPLVVSGTLDMSEKSPKIKATGLASLVDMREKMTRRVDIRLTATGASEDDLLKLKEVIGRYKGSCPIYLNITIPRQKNALLYVRAGDEHSVSPSEDLVCEVEALLGTGAVSFG